MEKGKYVLGLDTWEGSLDIQEQVLLDACVGFLIPRLNSISGSTHKDDAFDQQWAEAEPFVRWPYYVYNPRLTGAQNVEWLGDNLPAGVLFVAADIEVKLEDADYYAIQVADFYQRAIKHWKVLIYTGGWFTTYLTFWPKSEYWWARYPLLPVPRREYAHFVGRPAQEDRDFTMGAQLHARPVSSVAVFGRPLHPPRVQRARDRHQRIQWDDRRTARLRARSRSC